MNEIKKLSRNYQLISSFDQLKAHVDEMSCHIYNKNFLNKYFLSNFSFIKVK